MGEKRKTKKLEVVTYRFGLVKERDRDIITLLNSVPRPMRGQYIAESIRIARIKVGLEESNPETKPSVKSPLIPFEDTFDF